LGVTKITVYTSVRPTFDQLLLYLFSVWIQYPESCGKFVVQSVRDLTTGYDSSRPDGKAVSSVLVTYHHIRFFRVGFQATLFNLLDMTNCKSWGCVELF